MKFVNYKFEGKSAVWLDYAAERKGRFVGLQNKVPSPPLVQGYLAHKKHPPPRTLL